MAVVATLNGMIGRIQAIPDRHLTGLYATLALLTAICVRMNSPAAGLIVVVAFFVVGAIRAVKHPQIGDVLLAFMIGAAAGAGASGMAHALAPSLTEPRTGVLLISFGGMAFAYSAAIVSPVARWIAERGPAVTGG